MSDLLYTPPERPIYEPASNMYVSIIRDNSGNIFQRIYGKTAAMADIFARIFYYCACPAGLEFGEFQTRRDSITPGTWRQSPNTSNAIIADIPWLEFYGDHEKKEVELYGGIFVAESVRPANLEFICAAKEMLLLSAIVLRQVNRGDLQSVRNLDSLIKKFL